MPEKLKEFYISVIGNVDSGKSTTVGALVNPGLLDDGNGILRKTVFKHPHERVSGRTSDVSQRYVAYSDRILNFIDLCGHEKYLRTTINGLSSVNSDLAIVCISDKITRMTKEHLGICILLGIPIIVIFTKIDLIPTAVTTSLVAELRSTLSNKKLFEIKRKNDIQTCKGFYRGKSGSIVSFIKMSNKTGVGMDLLVDFLQSIEKRELQRSGDIFRVEHIYNVTGYGKVLSGVLTGTPIKMGDTLYIGPFNEKNSDTFVEVTVKTIHDDYKNFTDRLENGYRGCVSIRYDKKYGKNIKKGLIITSKPELVRSCKRFRCNVKLFHHQTTVQPGYQAFANIGTVSENIRIISMTDLEGNDIDMVRNGTNAIMVLEFVKNSYYIEPDQYIIFREASTKGIGKVIEIL